MRSLPFLFASACYASTEVGSPSAGGDDTADTPGGDTAADSGDPGDTADSGDSGDTAAESPTLVFTTGDDVGGYGFALAAIQLRDGEAPADAGILVSADADAEVPLYLDDPPGSMTTSDGTGAATGVFIPVVFMDEDGDGEKDPTELVVGAGESWVFWFSEEMDPFWAGLGFEPGYNAAHVVVEPFSIDVMDNDDVPYSLNLELNTHVTIGGTMAAGVPDVALGIVALSLLYHYGIPVLALIYDEPHAGGDWTLELNGRPPADHFYDFDGDGEDEAIEQPFVYLDNDTSSSASEGDTLWSAACTAADEPAYLYWRELPSSPADALVYAVYGVDPGWLVIAGESLLDGTAAGQLELGREACAATSEE